MRVRSVYERQHPERIAAHRAVKAALEAGRLAKPIFCPRCFRRKPVEAHHDDYRKPLKVRWLCRACHTHVHYKTQKNAPKKAEWDAWSMTKALKDLKDAEEKDYISHIEEVSETQLIFKPRGVEEGGRFRDREKPASAKDDRLVETIEAILGLGFAFKIVKVKFGE